MELAEQSPRVPATSPTCSAMGGPAGSYPQHRAPAASALELVSGLGAASGLGSACAAILERGFSDKEQTC